MSDTSDQDRRDQHRRILGNIIRRHREALSLSQQTVADRWGGVSQGMVSAVEGGRTGLSVDRLNELCSVFGIESSDVLREVEREAKKPAPTKSTRSSTPTATKKTKR